MESSIHSLPAEYRAISGKTAIQRIRKIKQRLGDRLVILGHHYQRDSIVEISDFVGDSFDLSRRAANLEKAEFIVFCGVRFMAESAAVLAKPHQKVIHPDPDAGCPLADFAPVGMVKNAWKELETVLNIQKVMPVVYVNSSAALKAFVGDHGGTTCTSSNARKAFEWALRQREKVFFFPDRNLGKNTANFLRIPDEQVADWDPYIPFGGLAKEEILKARVLLWKGYCHVHTWFRKYHVEQARENYPEAAIIVHPECDPAVVRAADGNGSTKFIVAYVRQASAGSTIVIGTEINLVNRLADQNPDKKIVPLSKSPCPNMGKVSPNDVLYVLENLGEVNVVCLPKPVITSAGKALQRMLDL